MTIISLPLPLLCIQVAQYASILVVLQSSLGSKQDCNDLQDA